MIVQRHYNVVPGGLDWAGFTVEEEDSGVIISEGRVGRTYCPLVLEGEYVYGGWYLDAQKVVIYPSDRRIDVVLDTEEDRIYLLVREDDTIVPEHLEIVFTLLRREDEFQPWSYSVPLYTRLGVDDENRKG